MLAKLAREPFDDPEYQFEVKWDGIRALAFVEGGAYRLHTRSGQRVTERYPELGFLAELPPGLVLDGELVVLKDGRPSFADVLAREQARGERRIRQLTATNPAGYVVFDVLWAEGVSVMDRPLRERRALLETVCADVDPRLVLSEALAGSGPDVFEIVSAQGLEGVVAKRLSGRYHPGRRTDEWLKIKTFRELQCAILGWTGAPDDVRSLIVGAVVDGELRCVGKVGSGLGEAVRRELARAFAGRARAAPLVPCPCEGRWVEPGLYCVVSFLEFTRDGMLRAPVFRQLVHP